MAINIKSGDADRLAREVARVAGESITEAVTRALAERLTRLRRQQSISTRRMGLREIRERASRLPVLDERSDESLLGYDEDGAFE